MNQEGSISNIAFVLKDGTFAYPSPEKTIRGTTLKYAIELISKELVPNLIKTIEIKDVNIN